ncbi:MAG: hypothetical protein ACI8P9_004980 [Parasphingorhabdus sp.]|jgi:hypothetical protein
MLKTIPELLQETASKVRRINSEVAASEREKIRAC